MCLDRVWGNLSLRCSLFFCKNQSVSSQVHFTVWLAIHACLCFFCFHSFCLCCWYFVCSVRRSTLVSQFHNSIWVKSFRAMALYFPIWNSISYRLFSSLWKSFPSMWVWNDLAKCYFNVKWYFLFCDFPVCLFFTIWDLIFGSVRFPCIVIVRSFVLGFFLGQQKNENLTLINSW